MHVPQDRDPLGISVKSRAKEHRRRFEAAGRTQARQQGQLVGFGQLGPLPDPQWDGMLQAWEENGVNRVRGGSLPQARLTPQLGAPSVDAIDRATGTGAHYEDHDTWTARHKAPRRTR